MDWLKELLKNAGVDESKIGDIVEGAGKEVYKHFVSKTQYNDMAETKKRLETDLSERDKQFEGLKKSAGDNEELKAKIKELQEANKTAAEKYQKEAKELQLKTALKLKLAGKVHETALDDVLNQFDTTKIELDEHGNIKGGYDDQEKSLRESKGFYFVPEKPDETTFFGLKPFNGGGSNDDKGNKGGEFGKQLAAQNKQSSDKMQEAQKQYFGG
ncbi:hypothetical protein J1TS5_25750 [Paenibacillus macerans]|uniref:phage scaffolding protein n=1 Tax=Paenibacillus macerans TaxID=44252 RepID=UPI001B24B66C|nr:phage scaffolding protein [Paenibacillus macerans]GIP10405.1 hypothetical protein J1TS5_25750 [Paenibacillus macerans]